MGCHGRDTKHFHHLWNLEMFAHRYEVIFWKAKDPVSVVVQVAKDVGPASLHGTCKLSDTTVTMN